MELNVGQGMVAPWGSSTPDGPTNNCSHAPSRQASCRRDRICDEPESSEDMVEARALQTAAGSEVLQLKHSTVTFNHTRRNLQTKEILFNYEEEKDGMLEVRLPRSGRAVNSRAAQNLNHEIETLENEDHLLQNQSVHGVQQGASHHEDHLVKTQDGHGGLKSALKAKPVNYSSSVEVMELPSTALPKGYVGLRSALIPGACVFWLLVW